MARKDVLEQGQLVVPGSLRPYVRLYATGYRSVARLLRNGGLYIGNIAALQVWYDQVRRPLMTRTPHGAACFAGAVKQLAAVRQERMMRLEAVVERIAEQDRSKLTDALRAEHEALCSGWPAAKAQLEALGDTATAEKDAFLAAWMAASEEGYVERVRGLSAEARAAGSTWLQSIVTGAEVSA